MELAIPPLLDLLVASGRWPSRGGAARRQPFVAREHVRQFAPEEDQIFLQPPPFHTIAQEVASVSSIVVEEFWGRYGSLNEIAPEKALILGDFGPGSDAPIILNYAADPKDPPVFRLRWREGRATDWVQGARNFAEFASLLGLTETVA